MYSIQPKTFAGHLQDIWTFDAHAPAKTIGCGSLETQLPEVASSRSALQAALPADFVSLLRWNGLPINWDSYGSL
jgi:hypothetical protein